MDLPRTPAEPSPEPIAIVGVGVRFPGGNDGVDQFDEFLREGRSGIVPLPSDRWDVAAFTPETPADWGKIHTSGGGFLDRIDEFDAAFFNISPKEADFIDPQQRMVLQTAWQALEHSGIDPAPLRRGNGAVYIGASSIDYALDMGDLDYSELAGHLAAGITMFPLSGRLSYFLGWRGPSISVDTACSSSLVAVHLAVQALRTGETDIALAGGVNALHNPRIPIIFSHANMLAADGLCKTFDESADGYVRAEGCGILVLKRLSTALTDGDRVLAAVSGTAVGQDGDSAGLSVPNGVAQETVLHSALRTAGLGPCDVQYVEAHGTGTPLGDPIEMGAISSVFGASHTREDPLLVGSVKTNLGHMEAASGVVGMVKTLLQLRSAAVYPHLNLTAPSARIPWDRIPVEVPTAVRPWPRTARPRRAVVNSFGFAGTIAAVVLEEAPPPVRPAADPLRPAGPVPRATPVLTVSGRNKAGLRRQADRWADHLRGLQQRDGTIDLATVCRASNTTRSHLAHRLAVPATDLGEVLAALDDAATRDRPAAPAVRKIAFLFSGQGSQHAGMGARLYGRHRTYQEVVDECDSLFRPHVEGSLRALVLGEGGDPDRIHDTCYTQPALFAHEYALARLWLSWGVRPSVLAGHSLGEVAAATVAGLLPLPDAVNLVAARAQAMAGVERPGAMVAVGLPADEVLPMLAEHPEVSLAAVNAPTQCVVSGAAEAVDVVTARLEERGARTTRLTVGSAFHSPLMDQACEEFAAAIADVRFQEPSISLVSNVTGRIARFQELADPGYWVRHIRQPVLFGAGVRAIAKRGKHAFVEIGPSSTLLALARQNVADDEHLWLPSADPRRPAAPVLQDSLARLHTAGLPVSWAAVHAGGPADEHVDLPTYAFEKRRHWLPPSTRTGGENGSVAHPVLGRDTTATLAAAERDAGVREFTAEIAPDRPQHLADHDTGGGVVVPIGVWADVVLAAQDAVHGHTRTVVDDLVVAEPLVLTTPVAVRTRLVPVTPDTTDVEIHTGSGGERRVHARARLDGDGWTARPAVDLLDLAGADARPDEFRGRVAPLEGWASGAERIKETSIPHSTRSSPGCSSRSSWRSCRSGWWTCSPATPSDGWYRSPSRPPGCSSSSSGRVR